MRAGGDIPTKVISSCKIQLFMHFYLNAMCEFRFPININNNKKI